MIGLVLTAIAGITSAGALTAIPYLGAFVTLATSRVGKIAGVGLLLAGLVTVGFWKGEASANAKCEAASLRGKLAAAEADRDVANARAARSQLVITALQASDAESQKRIGDLTQELATRPLQSTQQGAKTDANALLDDRCNYTPLGARRLR